MRASKIFPIAQDFSHPHGMNATPISVEYVRAVYMSVYVWLYQQHGYIRGLCDSGGFKSICCAAIQMLACADTVNVPSFIGKILLDALQMYW